MRIIYDKKFHQHFRKRIGNKKKLYNKYYIAVGLFIKNPEDPQLKSHKLRGKMKNFNSFWVDDDCRVIYKKYDTHYYFYDIGSHDEVYE